MPLPPPSANGCNGPLSEDEIHSQHTLVLSLNCKETKVILKTRKTLFLRCAPLGEEACQERRRTCWCGRNVLRLAYDAGIGREARGVAKAGMGTQREHRLLPTGRRFRAHLTLSY